MKRNVYGALAILGVALIVSVPFVQAQSRLNADVPFAFSLQDKAMPAITRSSPTVRCLRCGTWIPRRPSC